MTKTLRKERIEKFLEILKKHFPETTGLVLIGIAEELETASLSRSEVRGIEAAIFADRPVTEDDMEEKTIRAACNEFESALGFGSLPWDSTADWTQLRKFVIKVYQTNPQEFRKFEEWRKGEGRYQGCTNKSIYEKPRIFIDTHYPTFKASTAMYKANDEADYRPRISA